MLRPGLVAALVVAMMLPGCADTVRPSSIPVPEEWTTIAPGVDGSVYQEAAAALVGLLGPESFFRNVEVVDVLGDVVSFRIAPPGTTPLQGLLVGVEDGRIRVPRLPDCDSAQDGCDLRIGHERAGVLAREAGLEMGGCTATFARLVVHDGAFWWWVYAVAPGTKVPAPCATSGTSCGAYEQGRLVHARTGVTSDDSPYRGFFYSCQENRTEPSVRVVA